MPVFHKQANRCFVDSVMPHQNVSASVNTRMGEEKKGPDLGGSYSPLLGSGQGRTLYAALLLGGFQVLMIYEPS